MGKKEEAERLRRQAALAERQADTPQGRSNEKNWRKIAADLRARADKLK